MNADQLLAHYERVADAPDAIPRLRRFVLDLAVRGKLVPQDPNDGAVSELLKRVAKEKEDTSGRKGKRQFIPGQRAIANAEAIASVPSTWQWSTLGDLSLKIHYGYTASANPTLKEVRLLRITDIQDNHVDWSMVPGCTIDQGPLAHYTLEKGDILIARTGGTIGKTFLVTNVPVVAVFASYLIRVRAARSLLDRYIKLFCETDVYWIQLKAGSRGAGQPNVNGRTLGQMFVPLPPLAEQHRIVDKVDELMALCDRLEVSRTERETTRDGLTAASFARLNTPDPDTFPDDARFALDALPALTARADQIKQLRQTILNLAILGKLLPQDPNDEPVSELLNRIAAERATARRLTIAIDSRLEPFAIPLAWKWVTLGELVIAGPQNGISPKPTKRDDAPMAITLTATTSGIFDPTRFKRVEIDIPDNSDLWLREGDLLFQRGNTREYVGIAAIYNGPPRTFLFPDLIMRVRLSDLLDLRFVHLAATSPPARAYFAANASGASATMPKINQATLVSLPVPLPSLAEQRRIVAKLDELMTLCDRLEASLVAADGTRQRLLEAILAEALAPPEARELEAAE